MQFSYTVQGFRARTRQTEKNMNKTKQSQKTSIISKFTKETLENGVNRSKVNNKDTRTTIEYCKLKKT